MRNKFTNREKKLLLYSGFFCAALLILWMVFAPDRGALDLFRAKRELKRIQAENIRLKSENKTLQDEINRLQNDPAYLEEKARKEYGMLKDNEVLYIFKNKKK
jgi:cell division protein FtsB